MTKGATCYTPCNTRLSGHVKHSPTNTHRLTTSQDLVNIHISLFTLHSSHTPVYSLHTPSSLSSQSTMIPQFPEANGEIIYNPIFLFGLSLITASVLYVTRNRWRKFFFFIYYIFSFYSVTLLTNRPTACFYSTHGSNHS